MIIKRLKFSEILKPNIGLIDPGLLDGKLNFHQS